MRYILTFVLGTFLALGGIARADEPAAPPATKIGVVDMQTIAMECDAAKAFKEQMESKYGKERSTLEKQGQNLKKQTESLKNPKVSEAKKVEFLKSRQKLEQDTRNFMRKIEQEELKFRQDMVSLVFAATYEVSRAKGYTFVVDVTGGGVLYADPSMDLTKDVLAEVNKIYAENKAKQPAEAPRPAAEEKKPAKK